MSNIVHPQQKYADVLSSVTIPDLQEGQRYCAAVQYIVFDLPVGLATCARCELIPKSSKTLLVAAATKKFQPRQ